MKEIVAVGVSSSPNSAKLIQWAKRTSDSRGCGWCAIHVDDGSLLAKADRERLEANLESARNLGAIVEVVVGPDVAASFISAARKRGAGTLVVGRSGLSGRGFLPRKATVTDKILRDGRPLDVVVVSDDGGTPASSAWLSFLNLFSAPWTQYALLCGIFVLVTGACLLLQPLLEGRSVALIYLAVVLLLSLVSGPAPVAMMALVSSLAYNFFFIPPKLTFSIASTEDILLFSLYFLVAGVIGFLSAGLRSRERLLVKRDRAAGFLLSAVDRLSILKSPREAAIAASEIVDRYLGGKSAVYLDSWDEEAECFFGSASGSLTEAHKAAARRCVAEAVSIDAPISESGGTRYRFLPASAGASPVVAIGYEYGGDPRRREEVDGLLLALGRNLALFVERARSEELSRKAAIELESERLAKLLFDSVSHEMKTPLTSITGSLSALRDGDLAQSEAIRTELLGGALQSAERLTRIVDDLLSIGRIEAGALKLKREPVEASELAQTAAEAVSKSLGGRELHVVLPAQPHAYSVDSVLVNRLIVNLLENACRYSLPGAPISLLLADKEGGLSLKVEDAGPGFSRERMSHPFAKFAKRSGDKQGGLGLGLAICKGIAEAHGGRIEARRTPTGFQIEAILPRCGEGE